MTEEEILDKMLQIATDNNVKLDMEVAKRIAKFKAKRGQDLSICICEPNADGRGCIGPKCAYEIREWNKCHCNLFYICKKETNKV